MLLQVLPALLLLAAASATPRKTYKREGKPPTNPWTNNHVWSLCHEWDKLVTYVDF